MSASGPTLFPPGVRPPSPPAASGEARAAEVISLPPAREDDRGRARHLRGSVIQHEDDGRIRVRTDRGEVRLRLDPRTPPLPEGQQVDIDIPPGDAPQKVFLKALPARSPEPPPSAPKAGDVAPVPIQDTVSTSKSLPPAAPSAAPPSAAPSPDPLPVRLVFLPPAQWAALNETAPPDQTFFQSVLASVFSEISDRTTLPPPVPSALILPDISDILFPSGLDAPSLTARAESESPFLAVQILSVRLAASLLPNESAENGTLRWLPLVRTLPAAPPDVFSTLAQGVRTVTSPAFPSAAPERFDAHAFSIPGQIDIRLLKAEYSSLRLAAPASADPKRHMSVFHPPSGAPEGVLSGAAGTISGIVAASSGPGGHPVAALFFPESPFPHFFTMHTGADTLAQGAPFEAFITRPATLAPSGFSAPPDHPDSPATFWPALDGLFQEIQSLAPIVAGQTPGQIPAQSLAHILPNPAHPALIGPAIVFFIAALRAGDMGGWIGEKTLDALRRAGKTEALSRMERDFSILSDAAARQADDAGWKSLPVPFLWENRIHRALLHHRSDPDGRKDSDGQGRKSSTRFVFDLAFNRLGAVQVDCLYREKRLDVALRTIAPLSAAMRQGLRTRFVEALAQAGIMGEIQFQSNPDAFLKIPTRARPGSAWV